MPPAENELSESEPRAIDMTRDNNMNPVDEKNDPPSLWLVTSLQNPKDKETDMFTQPYLGSLSTELRHLGCYAWSSSL